MSTVREPFLHPTRRAYYRRVTIPKNLRQYLKGSIEVWRSLKTADPQHSKTCAIIDGGGLEAPLGRFSRIDLEMVSRQVSAESSWSLRRSPADLEFDQ